MKKFSFKAVALAASFIASGAAFAAPTVQDLDAATAAPAKFASEIKVASTGTDLIDGGIAASGIGAKAALGASFGNDVTAYVRFDLSSGKFKGDPSFAIQDTTPAAASVAISQGGDGASYVIFAVTPAAGKKLLGTTVGTFNPNATGITVKDQSPITLQYRLFETLTAAANPATGNTLKNVSASYITFANSLKTVITAATQVADVNKTPAYSDFETAGKKKLATVAITVSGTAKADGTALTANNLLAAKNTITVTGDFTGLKAAADTDYTAAAGRLTLESGDCGGVIASATSIDAGKAVFGNASTSLTDANLTNAGTICFNPATDVEIQAGTYSADVAYSANSGFAVSNVTGQAAGTINRNGTVLTAPITNQPAGWYSRLVLNNTGSQDRSYTVKAVSEAGNVITLSGAAASGTLAKNSSKVVDLQSLVTAVGGLPRYSLVVTVNAPAGTINGAYQIANGTTGMISNYVLK